MSDYKKKRQLIEENKDMYISDFDKSLSFDALSQIVDAKKNYAQAAKNNDTEGMTKYNDMANAVRSKYGNYTAGKYGNEYHPFVYSDTGYADYESEYEDELDKLYSSFKNTRFNYDYTTDPVYKAYKKVYEDQGNLAYERALAENSLKTGGIANTHAQSAATQAMGYYGSLLASKIPELYEAAYKKHYTDKKQHLADAYKLIMDRENRDYSRHKDMLENYRDIRDFNYRQNSEAENRDYSSYENESRREFEKNLEEYKTAANQALSKEKQDFEAEESKLKREFELSLANADAREKALDRQTQLKIAHDKSNLEKQLAEQKLEYEMARDAADNINQQRDQFLDLLGFYYGMMRDNIDDEKWRAGHNLNAAKAGFPSYTDVLGDGTLLDYAQRIFGDSTLTSENLFALLGLGN